MKNLKDYYDISEVNETYSVDFIGSDLKRTNMFLILLKKEINDAKAFCLDFYIININMRAYISEYEDQSVFHEIEGMPVYDRRMDFKDPSNYELNNYIFLGDIDLTTLKKI